MNNNELARIIITLLVISFVFGGLGNPIITLGLICVFLGGIYHLMNNLGHTNQNTAQRQAALNAAHRYLAPYGSIWKNLRLSNKNCSVHLGHDGKTITLREKVAPYRKCNVSCSENKPSSRIWEAFCLDFNHTKTYNDLLQDCTKYGVFTITIRSGLETEQTKPPEKNNQKLHEGKKLDINNCSEIELTELPGISIVQAKKIVKKRTEIGGFKHINEFFDFIKVKPHFEKQLKEIVLVNKMQKPSIIKRNMERSIDV